MMKPTSSGEAPWRRRSTAKKEPNFCVSLYRNMGVYTVVQYDGRGQKGELSTRRFMIRLKKKCVSVGVKKCLV